MYSNKGVKCYEWDAKKNEALIQRRGVSFEDVLHSVETGGLLAVMTNPRHAGQILYVVRLNGYVHCVPAMEKADIIRLITIYPSRKFNDKYKGASE